MGMLLIARAAGLWQRQRQRPCWAGDWRGLQVAVAAPEPNPRCSSGGFRLGNPTLYRTGVDLTHTHPPRVLGEVTSSLAVLDALPAVLGRTGQTVRGGAARASGRAKVPGGFEQCSGCCAGCVWERGGAKGKTRDETVRGRQTVPSQSPAGEDLEYRAQALGGRGHAAGRWQSRIRKGKRPKRSRAETVKTLGRHRPSVMERP